MTKEINLGLKDGTYGNITVVNGLVIAQRRIAVYPRGSDLLVEVNLRQSTNTDQQEFLDKLRDTASALGLTVKYVLGNLSAQFDAKERYTEFLKSGDTSGIEISDEEKAAYALIEGVKNKFKGAFALPPVPKGPYVRAKVTTGTDPLAGLVFNKSSIRSSSGYSMTNKQAKTLWEEAREKWRAGTARGNYGNLVRAAGYSYQSEIYETRIKIGCQQISRVTMEAVAEKMGWEF